MMALLKYTITYGGSKAVQELPKELHTYWTFWEEMTVEDGLILNNTRIFISPSMQESILLHCIMGRIRGEVPFFKNVLGTSLFQQMQDVLRNFWLEFLFIVTTPRYSSHEYHEGHMITQNCWANRIAGTWCNGEERNQWNYWAMR